MDTREHPKQRGGFWIGGFQRSINYQTAQPLLFIQRNAPRWNTLFFALKYYRDAVYISLLKN